MIKLKQLILVCFGLNLAITSSLMLIQRRTPPPDSMIVYQGRIDDRWHLYVMNADGTNQLPLDRYVGVELPDWQFNSPRWSPDGRWIVFGGYGGLYRLRMSDGWLDPLTSDPAQSIAPTWSPDGRWIAYIGVTSDGGRLFRMRHDGTQHEIIATDVGVISGPSWSPDGEWIAFQTPFENPSRLYRIRPDGSGISLISGCGGRNRPSWSPDSQWILCHVGDSLYKIRPDDTDLTQLTDYAAYSPAWSPDGKRIAFTADIDRNYRSDIYQIRLDGSHLEQITDANWHEVNPHYSPVIDKPFAGKNLFGLGLFFLIVPIGIGIWHYGAYANQNG